MRVRLLGTAAGGGFPQWNCNCRNCSGIRSGSLQALPRSQSCVAISPDNRRWFLLNASPDIRTQIESFASLQPAPGLIRGTAIEGVLLTNADLDHVLGLFILREGSKFFVCASSRVRQALTEGLNLAQVLEHYCGLDWREPPWELSPLLTNDGKSSGLHYAAFPVSGKSPRYLGYGSSSTPGGVVAYRFVDEATGGRLLFMPDIAALDGRTLDEIRSCDALLIDGTFWSDDEMQVMTSCGDTASKMGHLPVGGARGSLVSIASLSIPRKVYIHINNTNPMLIEDSAERAAVEAAGAQIGWDGMEFEL
jgi:pyrroloquinoline quinone biosynthesis protein B